MTEAAISQALAQDCRVDGLLLPPEHTAAPCPACRW